MLAGRKLLLADDSITIQKVVDLTFADEGVSVVCVNNGREAIDWLQEFTPDVVLADVFMPEVSGYEVCDFIKQSDRLKHVPVMLLVGSFEPFDEEEARRVGADDTLTKPFQSIRRLIEKVGLLSSDRLPEEQIPTAELPRADEADEPEEKLTTAELEITTADTRPLPGELKHVVEEAASQAMRQAGVKVEDRPELAGEQLTAEAQTDAVMESEMSENNSQVVQPYEGAGEVLLDLGDYGRGSSAPADDFVLDIDLDETPEPSPSEPTFSAAAFRSRESYRSLPKALPAGLNGMSQSTTVVAEPRVATTDPLANTLRLERVVDDEVETPAVVPPVARVGVALADASGQQLSPEMIEVVARRAVEMLSEKVVQEIAWEVVPQLAELLIKRQLEEKNS